MIVAFLCGIAATTLALIGLWREFFRTGRKPRFGWCMIFFIGGSASTVLMLWSFALLVGAGQKQSTPEELPANILAQMSQNMMIYPAERCTAIQNLEPTFIGTSGVVRRIVVKRDSDGSPFTAILIAPTHVRVVTGTKVDMYHCKFRGTPGAISIVHFVVPAE